MIEHVVVMMTTFRRPELLRRALASLSSLVLPEGVSVTALVIDNDAGESGAPADVTFSVCSDAETTGLRVRLVGEPTRGLSAARNRALDEAWSIAEEHGRSSGTPMSAHAFAFMDDDEEASPGWLGHLLGAMRTFDADAVTGPVVPRFGASPPGWLAKGAFLGPETHPTGQLRRWAFTNNVLMRAESFAGFRRSDSQAGRFSDRLTRAGSEDRHFFQRWTMRGLTIVWCDEATVSEHTPEERTTKRWLYERKSRIARASTWIERDLRPAPVAVPKQIAKGLVWIAIGGAGTIAALFRDDAARVRARVHLLWGVGLLVGLRGRLGAGYA